MTILFMRMKSWRHAGGYTKYIYDEFNALFGCIDYIFIQGRLGTMHVTLALTLENSDFKGCFL